MDLLEYNASLLWNLIPSRSIMFVLPEPSIKFAVPDMVFTLAFVNVKSTKCLLSQKIVCGCTVNQPYIHHSHSS